ncbi:MAG: helix-turn-helix domain-containing protein [Sphingomonas sp.]
MKIGDLARATGTRVETIRYYEAEGLIPKPERSAANYRIYDQAHLARLSFIRRSRDLGFTLDQVRTLLRLADDRDASCGEVDAITATHVAEIDRKLTDLQALRSELVRRLDTCRGPTIADCRIIEALAPTKSGLDAQSDVLPGSTIRALE